MHQRWDRNAGWDGLDDQRKQMGAIDSICSGDYFVGQHLQGRTDVYGKSLMNALRDRSVTVDIPVPGSLDQTAG